MAGKLPGPLESDLLSGNQRLQNCAQFDRDHVMPGSPAEEHVRLIQDALRQTDNADIPASENYGDKTTTAVVKFKTKHNIFTRGTRSIDPIVGINTIRKLDKLMKDIEDKKKKEKPPEPPQPSKPVPRLELSGQCQLIGELKDNPGADDLKFGNPFEARKSVTTTAITAPFVLMDDLTLEHTMQGTMATAVVVAGGNAGLSLRLEVIGMCDHFFNAAGAQRTFGKGSSFSNEAKTDVGFNEFVNRVVFEVDRTIRAAWRAGVVNDRAIAASLRPKLDSPRFGTGKFSGALTACIGGFQGYRVQMCGLTADTNASTFTYNLDVEITDHFGVDDSDINRNQGAAGTAIGTAMASFFVLQHDRNEGGLNRRLGKYRPFRVILAADMGPFTGKAF